jgi:hypothetical protein
MKSNRRFYIAVPVLLACIALLWLSTSAGQGRRRYEVETQVYGVPEYRTEAARAVDAYERLMERYMDLTELNLFNVSADVKAIAATLDRLDARLATLDTRLARIEKHLGIAPVPSITRVEPEPPQGPATDTPPPPTPLP